MFVLTFWPLFRLTKVQKWFLLKKNLLQNLGLGFMFVNYNEICYLLKLFITQNII